CPAFKHEPRNCENKSRMIPAPQMTHDECRGEPALSRGHLPCIISYFSGLFLFLFFFCATLSAETINLAGKWALRIDPQDCGITSQYWAKPFDETIQLPGTLSQALKGNPLAVKPVLPGYPLKPFNPHKGLMFGRDESVLTNSPLAHLY